MQRSLAASHATGLGHLGKKQEAMAELVAGIRKFGDVGETSIQIQ
jgi:hypothetical protein